MEQEIPAHFDTMNYEKSRVSIVLIIPIMYGIQNNRVTACLSRDGRVRIFYATSPCNLFYPQMSISAIRSLTLMKRNKRTDLTGYTLKIIWTLFSSFVLRTGRWVQYASRHQVANRWWAFLFPVRKTPGSKSSWQFGNHLTCSYLYCHRTSFSGAISTNHHQ